MHTTFIWLELTSFIILKLQKNFNDLTINIFSDIVLRSGLDQKNSRRLVGGFMMFTENIILSGVDDVKKFVHFVSDYNFKIELVSGNYAVDAKSIMGIFSLDLDRPIKMNAYTDDEKFKNEIRQFTVA